MSIFDIISDILFQKKKNTFTNVDNESTFSPFMLNRWFSMYSNTVALKCNLLNKFIGFNKQSMYSLFFNILDKVPTRKINYFKKNKDKHEEGDEINLFSNSLEISRREVRLYNELLTFVKKK